MKTFILIVELGSLAAAARRLNLSAVAVSKQLTKLENDLGVQLIIRSTRRLELTQIGKSYFLQCQRILEEVEVASALISQVKVIPNGILNIISGRHFAFSYIIPYLKEFLLKYPDIELNLEFAERIPDLQTESIDVVIGMSLSATGDVIQKKIATTSYVMCASNEYLQKFGRPEKPSDMINHCYITHSRRKPDNEIAFNTKEVVVLKPFMRVNDAHAMLNLALEGLGIVMLHHYVVEKYLEKGSLEQLLTPFMISEIPIYVAYPQRRFVPSKVRCFIDFIIEKMK